MAIDPSKTKTTIDFDVYTPGQEGSRINWFEQAKTITDAVTGVATSRQKRKDDIDADTKKNLDALNNLDQMDNKTLMDMTIDGSNNAATVIYEAEQAMKRGEMRPQDFQKLKNNISSGFTQFQKNAKSWDSDFKRYSERLQNGEGSSLEAYLGERMESFGNLKNLQLVTNPDTGSLAFGRIDENGILLTGPDDLISMNRMTAISKQEINRVDVGAAAVGAVEELGTYIKAGNAGSMGKDGRAIVTIEDFMQSDQADKYIRDKALQVLEGAGNFSYGSVLADSGATNEFGEKFIAGDQAAFDKWMSDNPNADESQNPVIVMGYKENGVVVEPAITEGQKDTAIKYVEDQIKAKLNYKEKMTPLPNPRGPSVAELKQKEADAAMLEYGKNLNLLITGDQGEADAAGNYIVKQYNNDKAKDKPQMNAFRRVDKKATQEDVDKGYADTVGQDILGGYQVEIEGMVVDPISAYDNEGNLISTDQALRILWKEANLDGTVDQYINKGGEVGETPQGGAAGGEGRRKEIKLLLGNDTVMIDKNTTMTYSDFFDSDKGGTLGSTLAEFGFSNDGNDEIQSAFTYLLDSPNFIPRDLKDFINKEGGKISVSVVDEPGTIGGGIMTITIGEEEIKYDDVYNDNKTGGTMGITQEIREAIKREIQRANTGSSGDDKDTKLTYPEWKKQNPNGTSTEYKTYFNQ